MRVLVVDDDQDVREALELGFGLADIETSTASNGVEALRALRSSAAPDVILLDLMMPVMNGIELLQILRSDDALRSIPVLVLSGSTTARATAAALGANGCLTKPVDLDELLAAVRLAANR